MYQHMILSCQAVMPSRKGLTGPDQLHISYVHSPIRYAWDLQHQYLRELALNMDLKVNWHAYYSIKLECGTIALLMVSIILLLTLNLYLENKESLW
jgi:lipopolysaccharide/colanic/teichoic acid biosynthesis glycosyltransferase